MAGKPNCRAYLAEDFGKPEETFYERVPTSIDVSTVWPLAFESGEWKGHLGAITGPVVIAGRYPAPWVKRGGEWLIRAEVFVALTASGPGRQWNAAP